LSYGLNAHGSLSPYCPAINIAQKPLENQRLLREDDGAAVHVVDCPLPLPV